MKAIVAAAPGRAEDVRLRELPNAALMRGHVRVRVLFAGVNFMDPLAEASAAHRDLESRSTSGKLLLQVDR